MWRTIAYGLAVWAALTAGLAVQAEEKGAAARAAEEAVAGMQQGAETPTGAESFFISDHVVLHLEGTDADVAILEQIARTIRHLLEHAILAENQKPWQYKRNLTLRLGSDIAYPPVKTVLALEDRDRPEEERTTRIFYYADDSIADFTANLRAYLWRILGIRFTRHAQESQVSSQVQLYLKGVDNDLPMLREMAAIVRDVLGEARPLYTPIDYPPRRLELQMDSEIIGLPYKAGLALIDLDQAEEERTVRILYYDPAQRQVFKAELRKYLAERLQVDFPQSHTLEIEQNPPAGSAF